MAAEKKERDVWTEFDEFARNWSASQNGVCACLGNCEICGWHKCHGCLCVFKSFIKDNFISKEVLAAKIEDALD